MGLFDRRRLVTTRVYLAGSSAEIDRARHWRYSLLGAGVSVVSTWIEQVERAGSANPRDATIDDRRRWTETCLREVAAACVLWLLVPSIERPTRLAWGELVHAHALGKTIISSGDTRQSIVTALGFEYADDDAAFLAVLARAGVRR